MMNRSNRTRRWAAICVIGVVAAACGVGTRPIEDLQLSDIPPVQMATIEGNCQIEIDNGYTTTPVDECVEQWIVDERAASRAWGIKTVEDYLGFYK